MGFDSEAENEASATPKLSFYKLPHKQKEPLVMFTPPINTLSSIPFQWEEAPGKPRADFTTTSPPPKNKNSVARCLDLPPRLLNNSSTSISNNLNDHPLNKVVTNVSSPTTVLDGPYGGRSFSHSSTFSSLPKGSFRSLEEQIFGEVKYQHHQGINTNGKGDVINKERYGSFKFASWRWGSYKENSTGRFSAADSFHFTSSVSSKSHSSSCATAKAPRFKRRSSFLSFSRASSNFLAGIYGSFKQVAPWRRRQERNKAEYMVGG